MTEKIKIGEINTLRIDRDSDHGLFLMDEEENSVLLPNAYVHEDMKIGDNIDVFVYKDSQDREIATTLRPIAKVNEFALMRVTDSAPFGAFVDWGLPKELLVPKKMQKNPLEIGKSYIIFVTLDEQTNRVVGDTRIGRYLNHDPKQMKELKEVDLLIIAKTPLGYKAIVNNRFEGMLYHNELYTKLNIGQTCKGYVKKVRDDGKFDLSLNPIGKAKHQQDTEKIIELLKTNNNTLPFTYKSEASQISEMFGMSKKSFKKALTTLIQEDKIILNENSITVKSSS